MTRKELEMELNEIKVKMDKNELKSLMIDDQLSRVSMFDNLELFTSLTSDRIKITCENSTLSNRMNTINKILDNFKTI